MYKPKNYNFKTKKIPTKINRDSIKLINLLLVLEGYLDFELLP